MNRIFKELIDGLEFTGNIEKDSWSLFAKYNCIDTAEHSVKVANEAAKLAERFGENENDALTAGFLHDISGVFPNNKRIDVCNELGIEILDEERIFPSILHSKISKVMAEEIFNIKKECILDAIELHSTLKINASRLDMIVFIVDKIECFTDNSAFIENIIKGLNISLEHGTFAYLKYLYDNKQNLKVYHPWALEAYQDFINKYI